MIARSRLLDSEDKKNWDYSDDAELVAVVAGSVRVLSADGFQIFTLREGEGVFIPPRTITSLRCATESASVHSIAFPLSTLWSDTESAVFEKYSVPILSLDAPISLSPKAAGLTDKAFEILQQRAYCYELETRDLISTVLVIILKELEGEDKLDKIFEDDRLHKMVTFIKEHFSEDIALADIAASGNVSERECLRSFSRTLSISPVQYLINYRITESKKLLRRTDLSISEVAYLAGFSSPAHFSRSFREETGYSPSEWRRKF